MLLSVHNAKVQFGAVTALAIENFAIPTVPGVGAVILGPNGAGKTTLLNAITGYVDVRKPGQVILHGREVKYLARRSPAFVVRSGISRTFQSPCLFRSLTVGQVLWLAYRGPSSWSFRGALGSVRQDVVGEIASALGLEASTPTKELSLSLVRRLELGRALMTRPRLLLMDEPTAGLSDAEKGWLRDFIAVGLPKAARQLQASKVWSFSEITLGLVTHDMSFLEGLRKDSLLEDAVVAFMELGGISVSGSFDQVLGSSFVRKVYFGD